MPKWKHLLSDDEYEGKKRRGPRTDLTKGVVGRDRGIGKIDDRKGKPTPATVKHVQKYKGHDTANGRSICHQCGDPIRFTTNYNGQLVALDIMCGKPHRHQPPRSSPGENRRRIEEARRREKREKLVGG